MEYRTLHSWVRDGLIIPACPSEGQGHAAQLDADDVTLCKMLGRLRRAGCGMPILWQAADVYIPGAHVRRLPLGEGLILELDRGDDVV